MDVLKYAGMFEIVFCCYGVISSRIFFKGGWQYRSEPGDSYWSGVFIHGFAGVMLVIVTGMAPDAAF
ncbi:hypothetical protein [Pelagibaculum spongiae]|uniref:Uncharacterized protein n=1 Tax=Pelagibaculum spongiae TaxID=2080658 RepID=A0A2V1GYQ0_9GAMM|nr:hypothetical protein [Pelagibaculum spongiae]PVZ71896.1 hypothetical protein DC094_02420 [Pelagibaculum spongiae]